MQKTTTFTNKTDFEQTKADAKEKLMQPSENTLKNILQFAAVYRVEKIGKNQFVETFLN